MSRLYHFHMVLFHAQPITVQEVMSLPTLDETPVSSTPPSASILDTPGSSKKKCLKNPALKAHPHGTSPDKGSRDMGSEKKQLAPTPLPKAKASKKTEFFLHQIDSDIKITGEANTPRRSHRLVLK